MFERAHHRHVASVLQAFDADLLLEAKCWFGGGTAIVLQLGEYRESVDIDLLCSDRDGYRLLRSAIAAPTLGRLVTRPLQYRRDARTDRDKISAYVEHQGIPIRVEIVLESRIDLTGAPDRTLGVPVMSREDLYAEKLLANADRGLDRSVRSRDLIDLAMMMRTWGPIPGEAWRKVSEAYGNACATAFDSSRELIGDRTYFLGCLRAMSMDPGLIEDIYAVLDVVPRDDASQDPHA